MFTLIALSLATYRLPLTPTSYWIWEDLVAARAWQRHHRVCITKVPDGFATKGC